MQVQDKIEPLQVDQLTIPFSPDEVQQLNQQRILYEKMNQVNFIDLGSFISHIVARQLQYESEENSHNKISEIQLIKASHTIGLISTSNCHYTAGLTAKLTTLNKPLQSITIGELIEQDKAFNVSFNQMMEG